MSESRGSGGVGWLWPLMALVVLVGVFALGVASVFPEGIQFTSPRETASVQEQIPVVEEASIVELKDIVADPVPYYGKDVVATIRVNFILNSRTMWVGSREDASQELFAVVARGIDLNANMFRNWQIIKVYATVRPLQEDELKAQGVEIVGRSAWWSLQSEESYLLIKGLIPSGNLPFQEVSRPVTPTVTLPQEGLQEELQEGLQEGPQESTAETENQ